MLLFQNKILSDIHFPAASEIEKNISQSELILNNLGYSTQTVNKQIEVPSNKKRTTIPTWKSLVELAEKKVGTDCSLESLFTEEELKNNKEAIRQMNAEYNALHKLDEFDIAISAIATIVSATVEILLVGIPQKTYTGLKAGPLSNYIRAYFNKKYPAGLNENLDISKVPYDAQDNRNTRIHVEELSAYYHRLLSLGHDPILGFVIGVMDIMTGKMTTIDKSGKVVSQVIEQYAG